MLHEFLISHHAELIRRCRSKAEERSGHVDIPRSANQGVPVFLEQLTDILRLEHAPEDPANEPPEPSAECDLSRSAALHGVNLVAQGFSIDQLVHEYGDVCQAVTALALDLETPISTGEFRTLNRCLDNAIADAVRSYSEKSQTTIDGRTRNLHVRMEALAGEHGRLVEAAVQAFSAIRSGLVGLSGPTGSLLAHSLAELEALPKRALSEFRRMAPMPAVDGKSGTLGRLLTPDIDEHIRF